MFNLGRSPYPAMGPTEVVDFLGGGSRLKNPNSITCSESNVSEHDLRAMILIIIYNQLQS